MAACYELLVDGHVCLQDGHIPQQPPILVLVVFLDFVVEKEENVFPMVPAGEAINKMISGGLA